MSFNQTQLAPDDSLTFFPTYGHWDALDGHWQLPVHGWAFKTLSDGFVRSAARAVFRRALGLKGKHQEDELFQRRSSPFLVDNRRGIELEVRIGGREHRLPPTGPNGHTRHVLRLSAAEVGKAARLTFRAALPQGDERELVGEAHLLSPDGLSVISDIDDTIKISDVRDRQQLMKNTFVRPFAAVTGMAKLYGELAAAGASFHYVTSAPWQLFQSLEEFREAHGFPAGSLHMKKFRLKDRTLFDLFASPAKSKPKQIEPLLAALPARRFVLIGDSGERDPEIYAELARRFPARVQAVLIRDVTGEGRTCKRMKKTFRGLPSDKWQVFASPEELNWSPIVAGES